MPPHPNLPHHSSAAWPSAQFCSDPNAVPPAYQTTPDYDSSSATPWSVYSRKIVLLLFLSASLSPVNAYELYLHPPCQKHAHSQAALADSIAPILSLTSLLSGMRCLIALQLRQGSQGIKGIIWNLYSQLYSCCCWLGFDVADNYLLLYWLAVFCCLFASNS